MDYKEKYEMALEGIQEILGSGEESIKMSRLQLRLQGIFPELKESEDEKTKRILHSISSKMSFHLRDIFTEEEFQCFDAWSNAWLEKQEQVKALTDEDERIRKAIIALLNTTVKGKKLYSIADTTRSEMVNWLEKQEKKNEQSPKWKGIKDLEAAILAAHPTFEQKPAEWSEEDERVRKELIDFFSDLPDTDTFRGIPPSKIISWLEKQKQKPDDKAKPKFKVGDIV